MKPLVIDLFCGLGGWTKGFLAEGYQAIGFDIERPSAYPGDLILQDVLTLHGSQFRHAACIVASPPCQAYSYMAMPWKRGKEKAAAIRADQTGEQLAKLNALFDVCFRLQREACEAAGHHIPMVVENVKGAQPWVGRARWHYGSYYLWGDVPALMPYTRRAPKLIMDDIKNNRRRNVEALYENGAVKNDGGSWFGVAHNTNSGHSRQATAGAKCGGGWFGSGNDMSLMRQHNSKSNSRKAASAAIAEIPFDLAQWIARCFLPA